MAPTTDAGKFLQCVISVFCVVGLAMPTGIINNQLRRVYTRNFRRLKQKAEEKEQQLMAEAAKVAAVKVSSVAASDVSQKPQQQGGRGLNIPLLMLRGLNGSGPKPLATTGRQVSLLTTQARVKRSRDFRLGTHFR